MNADDATAIADRYWAGHFGCPPEGWFEEPYRIVLHGGELTGYPGVFGLFRNGRAIISVPAGRADLAGILSPGNSGSPMALATTLTSPATTTIGPAFTGYATSIPDSPRTARALTPEDSSALEVLEESCLPIEWEHGGSEAGQPLSGVFAGGRLAALAGYEVWGGTIAHIAIVTHPDFRGQGFGRAAVAHLAHRALAAGLLPQYRTLEANGASIGIATALGFRLYATSMAVRP